MVCPVQSSIKAIDGIPGRLAAVSNRNRQDWQGRIRQAATSSAGAPV